jgi:membrane-associated protease RseP (regulator of RpoE activity)
VSFEGYSQPPDVSRLNGFADPFLEMRRAQRRRWNLHILLLAATLITTSVMGAEFVRSFRMNRPVDVIAGLDGYVELLHHPAILLTGLPFSLTLMGVLLAHEMGHFLMCRYYGVDASPPYFLPFPLPIGTFGAFIRIRAPIYSKRVLFDVAVAGPLAGFFLLVPALAIGIAYSKVIPGINEQGDLVFGVPLIVSLLEAAIFPGVPAADIYLNPVARAAWVGVLATALNLLPIGQLDGGHILYSFVGERSRIISRILTVLLIPLGFLYSYSWLLWAAILFFFAARHPAIFDETNPGRVRTALGWLSLVMFILCFTVQPTRLPGRP